MPGKNDHPLQENEQIKAIRDRARSFDSAYFHIARALARGYIDLYYVNTDSGEFIEY